MSKLKKSFLLKSLGKPWAIGLILLAGLNLIFWWYVIRVEVSTPAGVSFTDMRLKYDLRSLPVGTPRAQVEKLLKESGLEYGYYVPSETEFQSSGIPRSKIGGVLSTGTDARSSWACVQYELLIYIILDKEGRLLKVGFSDRCVERIF